MPDEFTEFGKILDRLIRERLGTASRFCEVTGEASSLVSRVMTGERYVPKERLAKWAKALSLKGAEAEDFIVDGELSDAPTARRRITLLRDQAAEFRASLAEASIRIDALTKALRTPGASPGRPGGH